jgi:xanthine dehydrogenase accessory factor
MPLTAVDIAHLLREAREAGRPGCLVTILPESRPPALFHSRLWVEAASHHGTLGDPALDHPACLQARQLLADERAEMVVIPLPLEGSPAPDVPPVRLLFEVARPPQEMIICGGGHVGQAVARAARLLDFTVTVIDDRTDFASREKFPDPSIRLIADDFVTALRTLRLTPASHVVIVTRGHKHDEICLREVIDQPVRYLGMIGSRRRTTTIREHLRRQGIDPQYLRRVHAPIGLDIGAQTPEEIALAILAEIVLVRRGGTGCPKSSEGPMARAR